MFRIGIKKLTKEATRMDTSGTIILRQLTGVVVVVDR